VAVGFKTGGRKKGTPNKVSALLKDAILTAAEEAGGKEGLIGYLRQQAKNNPAPFMGLLGKVLPMQIAGDQENPVQIADPNNRERARALLALLGAAKAEKLANG
jgi:hypothetical protein